MPVANTDRQNESKRIGGELNICLKNGVITDALVSGNATVAALITAIYAAVVDTKLQSEVKRLTRALNRGVSLGIIPATHGQTTVAGLVALTDASTATRQGFLG